MPTAARPAGYSVSQISLHWIIAALVIFQLYFGEDIKPAWRAFRRGTEATADQQFDANLHVYVGITILVLAVLRLAIRLKRGAPTPPADESPALKWIAGATHVVLYAVILGMPITGMLAWYFGINEMGEIHETAKLFIILFVTLHALAALWQHFVVKSDVLRRMLRPGAGSAA